jgi:chromosome segregation ATPase
VRRLRIEVSSLLSDLNRAETDLEEIEQRCANAEQARSDIAGSWQFCANQLELAEEEINDCNRIIEELTAEIADRDEELEQLDVQLMDFERHSLVAERARRELLSECNNESRGLERDAVRREKRLRERQQEFGDIRSAHNHVLSADQREERLLMLVQKLLGDLTKADAETERRNTFLKALSSRISNVEGK